MHPAAKRRQHLAAGVSPQIGALHMVVAAKRRQHRYRRFAAPVSRCLQTVGLRPRLNAAIAPRFHIPQIGAPPHRTSRDAPSRDAPSRDASSREAAPAFSCGRKPADRSPPHGCSREAAPAPLPPLRGSRFALPSNRGLTPTAKRCHRSAIPYPAERSFRLPSPSNLIKCWHRLAPHYRHRLGLDDENRSTTTGGTTWEAIPN
jgi:hypothetical protein